MSEYTITVRQICESYYMTNNRMGFNDVNKVLEKTHSNVFNFDYPIFDESYRTTLETMILRHFYTREIGFETVGLWKLKLNAKMVEIMPYYNKWFESELIKFNPLWDTDYTKTITSKDDNTSETKSNGVSSESGSNNSTTVNTDKNVNKYADTPQGTITNLENETYLTNVTINEDNGTTKNTGENKVDSNVTNNTTRKANNLNEYLETVQGNRGVFDNGTMLKHYRETFTNINKMILNELEDLFMLLW